MLQVSEIYVYPIKSLPGISLNSARVTSRGFEHDRRWMLVGENNQFLSQRTVPEMTQLPLTLEENGLRVFDKMHGGSFFIPYHPDSIGSAEKMNVTVWDDTCAAQSVSDEADEWFSNALGFSCRLVHMTDDSRRIVDQRYAPGDNITSFSDAYPFMIIGQASLDDLNAKLAIALPMARFRPNIVFTGGEPFSEDQMDHFIISEIDFFGVKLCARCPIPTIDPKTGHRGKEPLKTLARYRLRDNNVYFGQNLVHKGEGLVRVGDALEVKSWHTAARFFIPPLKPKIAEIDKTLI